MERVQDDEKERDLRKSGRETGPCERGKDGKERKCISPEDLWKEQRQWSCRFDREHRKPSNLKRKNKQILVRIERFPFDPTRRYDSSYALIVFVWIHG